MLVGVDPADDHFGVSVSVSGETAVVGSVSGSYVNTWAADGSNEVITETISDSHPRKTTSWLDHAWRFDVAAGEYYMQVGDMWDHAPFDCEQTIFTNAVITDTLYSKFCDDRGGLAGRVAPKHRGVSGRLSAVSSVL